MINFNGQCVTDLSSVQTSTSILSGLADSYSIYVPLVGTDLILWESFYFHLMAQLRQRRFSIPDHYTPDFFEDQWAVLKKEDSKNAQTLKITCFRAATPSMDQIYGETMFILEQENESLFPEDPAGLEIDLYKDALVMAQLDTQGGKKPQPITRIAEIFALENGWDASVLLHTDMHLAYSSRGTIYLKYADGSLKTPDLKSGGLSHPLSRAWEEWLSEQKIALEKSALAPFELQQAESILLCDPEKGFAVVSKYRKTSYSNSQLTEWYQQFKTQLGL